MNKERYLIVVSGPSGVGKDTVVRKLREKHPEIAISVSITSRAKREGEQEGVDYFYLTNAEFEQWIAENKVVEHTNYCGNYYGTPRFQIDERIDNGISVVLVIEVEGAGNIKRQYPESTTIFVCPPSMEALENRLRGRGTDSEEAITKRLTRAREEMAFAPTYDKQVINEDIEKCADEIYNIICERQKA